MIPIMPKIKEFSDDDSVVVEPLSTLVQIKFSKERSHSVELYLSFLSIFIKRLLLVVSFYFE